MKSQILELLAVGVLVGLVTHHTTASAETFTFATDPFDGTTVLTTPGRQIVGGEPSINFNIASDVLEFDPTVFGIGSTIFFASEVAENLPASGLNVIVLLSFDNDADPATPFGAGTAANLIANRITSPGAGFFIYFNSGLDLPRLVFSPDLDDSTSDLKILARFPTLAGQAGRDALATLAQTNFAITQVNAVPEPGTLALLGLGLVGLALSRRKR